MAMKIGSTYKYTEVKRSHFQVFAEEAGLNKPLVMNRLDKIINDITKTCNQLELNNDTEKHIVSLILKHCSALKR